MRVAPLLLPFALDASGAPRPVAPRRRSLSPAFTLVELITVMAIMVVIIAVAAPAMNSLKRSKDTSTAAFEMVDIFEQARTYAIANNTYTFVGIEEVDGSKSITAVPQSTPGVGRLAMMVIASKDGTIGVSAPFDLVNSWKTAMIDNKGANFTAVRKVQVFDSLHLVESTGAPPASGKMARFPVNTDTSKGAIGVVGSPTFNVSLNPFSWPLGQTAANAQFYFSKVLTFTPQGGLYNYYTTTPSMVNWWELALQQSKGNIKPTPPPNGNLSDYVALQVSGVTGISRIFRP